VSGIVALTLAACTATRTREFTQDAYLPGPDRSARVFEASPAAVREAVRDVLARRGAEIVRIDDPDAEETALLAQIPWPSVAEAREAVDLGRVRRVVTHTERSYRSWSPLHFRCDSCVIAKGTLTGQKTVLVEDATRTLDPDRYRIEARVEARIAPARSGTRAVLGLELEVDPRDPPDLLPRSTGRLEGALLDEIEAALLR